jgi:hypothetical protein
MSGEKLYCSVRIMYLVSMTIKLFETTQWKTAEA